MVQCLLQLVVGQVKIHFKLHLHQTLRQANQLISLFGTGGKGNKFFESNEEKTPQICEYGAKGEDLAYTLELRSMAHLGLVSTI